MLTWSSGPVVSYYEPLLSSSEAISGSKHENKQFQKATTSTLTAWLHRRCPPPPFASNLFLPRAIVILNNHRGIPPWLLNAVIIVVGCIEQRYMLLNTVCQQHEE